MLIVLRISIVILVLFNFSFAQNSSFNRPDSSITVPPEEIQINKIFNQPWNKLNRSLPMNMRLSLIEPSLFSGFPLWSSQFNNKSEDRNSIYSSVADQRRELLLSLQRSLKESAEMKFFKQVLTISEGAAAAYLMYEHFRKYKDKY